MKIAISASNNQGLESTVSHHFGRCPFFILVDVDDQHQVTNVQSIHNPYFAEHEPGMVPAYIQQHHADVMIAGGMGRRAIELFEQAGVEACTGAEGTVEKTLEAFFAGKLLMSAACKESIEHHHHDH
jgi:predicted Fe-Mo cluster-binding NifX family protein